MHVLAISGSLRTVSANTTILEVIERLIPAHISFSYFKGLDGLPYFNPDNDREGMKPNDAIVDWRSNLKQASAVIICTPEYALGVPGVLKNALDWIVSSGEFIDKPIAIISASPMHTGGDKAHASLMLTLGMMSANILERASFTIPFVKTKINAQGEITDNATLQNLQAAVYAITEACAGDNK